MRKLKPRGTRRQSKRVAHSKLPPGVKLFRAFESHRYYVSSLAFDPLGVTLASGCGDGSVKLWEAANGKLLRTIEGHEDRVCSVQFDPKGVCLASSSTDKTVKLWNAATGTVLRIFEGHENSVLSLAFDPRGSPLLAGAKIAQSSSGELAPAASYARSKGTKTPCSALLFTRTV